MTTDPLFDEILKRLKDVGDGNLFEECMVALLRPEWPTLVNVPGGNDGGMDGVWADNLGGGFLICTTEENVISNVTSSIEAHRGSSGPYHRVLVVTTTHLTPLRCRNIRKRVAELGFALAHEPYHHISVAERLLHDSQTRKRLLGIAGDPPALSRAPRSARPLQDLPLIGREKDLSWLRSRKGDRVVSGQPGIGKTHLVRALVGDGDALFAFSDDVGKLADAVRDQRPSIILVEDSHIRPQVLSDLCSIRRVTGHQFDIVADCWPGAAAEVQTLLNLPAANVRQIETLAPSLIVELIHHIGIGGPDGLVSELVRQANGRPGLAALLCYLCLLNDVQDVWRGDALSRILAERFAPLVGPGATEVLGACALGGWGGMRLDAIAEYLRHPVGQLRSMLTKLSAAGVVTEIAGNSIRVRPEPLRSVLVRDVFFNVQPVLSIDPLLERVTDRSHAAEVLCDACARGAQLDPAWLLKVVESAHYRAPWQKYIYASDATARLFLDRYPDKLRKPELATALLHRVPDSVLPKLFEQASKISDRFANLGGPSPFRNVISEWIRSGEPGTAQAVRRRELLCNQAIVSLRRDAERGVAIDAIAVALSPQFWTFRSEPGTDGASGTISQGLLEEAELQQVGRLWAEVAPSLSNIVVDSWRPLLEATRDWIWPRRRMMGGLEERTAAIVREVAGMLLHDIAAMNPKRPGVLIDIREMARHGGFPLPAVGDPEAYRLLRKHNVRSDYKVRHPRQARALELHARRWLAIGPREAALRIIALHREAVAAGLHHYRLVRVAEYVARETSSALPWFDSLGFDATTANVSIVFLRRASAANEAGWKERVIEGLTRREVRASVALIVLSLPSPAPEILRLVMGDAELLPGILRGPGLPSETPTETIRKLLLHDNEEIAGLTALWVTPYDQKVAVPATLFAEWRDAIVRVREDDPKLRELVKADRTIAFDWLAARLSDDDLRFDEQHSVAHTATDALDDDQRAQLMERLTDPWRHADLAILLARGPNAASLYEALLASDRRDLHLTPLRGKPTKEWVAKAKVAIRYGYTASQVAEAAYRGGHSWEGSEANMWGHWMSAFEELRSDDDPEMREVAQVGHDYAAERRNAAISSERRFRDEY